MIETGYCCGFDIGKSRVRVELRRNVGGIDECLRGSDTPPELLGLEGTVEYVQNDAYDTDRPTGYERVYLYVKPDKEFCARFPEIKFDEEFTGCFVIDMGFCRRLN